VIVFAATAALSQTAPDASQTPPANPPAKTPAQQEGWESGGYRIHQSIELGVRVNDTSGSDEMYDTLVNLHTGPRLLEQTLSMQSLTHAGTLFDNLWITSFGWGGDPNNALRARVGKNQWYDFRASFRRDQNFSDYNLLTNPLNPSTSSPTLLVDSSPHRYATRRRMTDLDLTLLPLSSISFRVGYSHNNMTGPSFSSVHEGTDALLNQPWNTTLNSWRFGADFKVLPRTVISYDQFLHYYKGDTTWSLAPAAPALLPGGAGSVELGLPIDTVNKTPCAIPTGQTSLIDSTGTLTNTACNAYFEYTRADRIRTSQPTERLSFRSNYFERIDLAGSFAYSSADMNSNFNEFFNGLSARSFLRQEMVTGPPHARQISDVADFTATIHITPHVRVVDIFRYWAYRIPESFNSTTTDWDIPGSGTCAPPACSLLIPISGTVATTTTASDAQSFNQRWTRNEIDVVWDVNKHLGARLGYRYGSKTFDHFLDFTTGDMDHIPIHENTALFGIWAKPMPNLRFNFDWEHTNNDNTIVRIGARKESRYRIQANYTPVQWATIGGMINLYEASNGDSLTDYKGHNRNYGFTVSLMPKERIGVDVAYNYNDFQQNGFICFADTPPAGVTLPVVTNAGDCTQNVNPNNPWNDPNNPLLTTGYYTNQTHYAMAAVRAQVLPRTTLNVGYSITSVGGTTPQFNILQPLGSLSYNYHQPLADVAIDLGHNLLWKVGWAYTSYGEKSFVGPTDPRNFHANNATISLRWAF
jgi:hypothetical protein